MTTEVIFDADLMRRYAREGPRYTSYPTAMQFSESVDLDTYAAAAAGSPGAVAGGSSAGSAGCFPTGPRRRWPAPCARERAPLRNRSPRRAYGYCIPSDHEPPKMIPLDLHPDRLFPSDPATRGLARSLYATVRDLPIVSPHGHTDPQWFADDAAFPDPSALLIVPDHYVFRMLYTRGAPHGAGAAPLPSAAPAPGARPYDARA